MEEYIKRQGILDKIDNHFANSNGAEHYAYEICKQEIQNEPSADVVEVKHGHWIVGSRNHGNEAEGIWTERFLQCSICTYERRHSWLRGEKPDYCEGCGAKMDGGN